MKRMMYSSKRLAVALTVITAFTGCRSVAKTDVVSTTDKPALMWFDAEANFERFSNRDSIDYYLAKIKDLGFTHAIVDVRPITGEVLYDSRIAPRMNEWHGYEREPFDYLGYFITRGHQLGLEVHASMNVFCAGHNYFNRGIIYDSHPEWASMVYTPERGVVAITEEKHKYGGMVNPVDTTYQRYIIDVMKELCTLYPELDGLMLDRVRFDGLSADFSPLSRSLFEEHLGRTVERFPQDIFEWRKGLKGWEVEEGPHFKDWIEWRTSSVTNFMKLARQEVKSVRENISFGTYTGAWYPTYYEVGVNFASQSYDPSRDFDWATPTYHTTGYAELIDLYATGNYYTDITKSDYMKFRRMLRNETDSRSFESDWYCVEGSCEHLRHIMGDNRFVGGILVDQFYDKPENLTKTIATNLQLSDGLMVFDIVHIITKNLWKEVEQGMIEGGKIPAHTQL